MIASMISSARAHRAELETSPGIRMQAQFLPRPIHEANSNISSANDDEL
jgi:hypothetical protein